MITRMLDQVEENLARYDLLRGGPDVASGAGLPETDDGDGIRARRMVMTKLDLAKIREYYPDFGTGTATTASKWYWLKKVVLNTDDRLLLVWRLRFFRGWTR